MPACPWCKAAVGDLLAPCPRCGRTSDEQGAIGAGLADVPELDIPARPSKVTAAAKPAAAPAAGSRSAAAVKVAPVARSDRAIEAERAEKENNAFADPGARTFEDEDDLAGGSLDLDLSNGPPLVADAPPAPSPPPAGAPAHASPSSVAGSVAPPPGPDSPRAPAKKGSREIKVEVDPFEARALADYGDAPEAWWRTPLYAFRVLRRRPELKKLADQKTREAERAKGAAEDALLSFAEVVRTDAEKLAAYGDALQAVRMTEDVLGQRDAILAAENDAHKHRQAEFHAKLAELEAGLAQIQIEERQVGGEVAEADALLKRAESRAKRVEAEMRNAIAQAEQGGAVGESLPPAKGPGA